jgi:hypothetical protein
LIGQVPTITITVYLVGGWTINDDLKWRRTMILLACPKPFAGQENWTLISCKEERDRFELRMKL